ncbi:putative S-layer protein [Candidatus Woesearchaeota archaeon]|jgi:uncharacterized membrane protein|nr:putative S-layer protein [Candidatus Woesearchaeota archaeon]MBT7237420.1 putative S-layer protein [Candidatus Woesearchaeota archaeon]
MKKLIFLAMFLILSATLANADLTTGPIDFGIANQGESKDATITLTNPDATNVTGAVLSASDFTYTNAFISTYLFDGTVTFNPSTADVPGNGSTDVIATVNVPLSTRMGEYESTITVTENATQTTMPATVFVDQYTGSVGNLNIIDTDSYDDIPDQMRAGNILDIDLDIENDGSADLTDVRLEVWLYDEDLKQIVAFEDSSDQTVDDGQEETFSVSLDVNDNLDADHNYDLYVKTYKTDDELNQHDVNIKDFDLLDESDFCDVGQLRIEEFDVDEDEYSQGDMIQIDVEIENNDNEDIDDVIVEVWVTERGEDRKLESEKSSKTDIEEDETETFSFEIEVEDDWDDGTYEVHVKAYEYRNEDHQCIEDVEEIDVERPDHKVIIDSILVNPSVVSCGYLFNAEVDVQNVGDRDDDAVKVRMYNSELGIDVFSETFDLEKYDDRDDDNTVYLEATIPEGMANKEYALTFTLYYDDLGEQKNYVEKITVNGCLVSEETEESEESDSTDSLAGESNEETSGTVFLPTGWSVGNFFDNETAKTTFWIVGDIALIVIIIYFLSLFFKKRK